MNTFERENAKMLLPLQMPDYDGNKINILFFF